MWLTISLKVQKASAKNAYCVYGHPSPFAFIGFAHALCEKAGIRQVGGVLAVFHDIEMHATSSQFQEFGFDMMRSAQRDSKDLRSTKGRTQVDTPVADMEISACFEIHGATYDGLKTRLHDTLLAMRFAGGLILDAQFRVSETSDEAFRMKAGFAMCAASLDSGPSDVFTRMLDKISLQKGKKGWFSPSLVGFRMIEDLSVGRHGARGGVPHAYADPLIGVVEFRSVRKASVSDMWSLTRANRIIKFSTVNATLQKTAQTSIAVNPGA